MNQMKRLDEMLVRFVAEGPAGCACSVIQHGEVLYEHHVGFADVATGRKILPDTLYRVFSMTKVMTCVAALQLYERGLYLLSDPLDEYLPEFANPLVYIDATKTDGETEPAKRPLRVRDLFMMTSGLSYAGDANETARQTARMMESFMKVEGEGKHLDTRTFSRTIAKIPLAFQPGSRWMYGTSHDVLGAFIEAVSGKTLGQYFEENILRPLGLRNTFFRYPVAQKDKLCTLYERSDAGVLTPAVGMDTFHEPGALFEQGGGGLLSTLRDYQRFAQALSQGGTLDGVRIIGGNTLKLMATNHLNPLQQQDFNWDYLAGYGYGLGVRVMVDPAAGGCNGSIGEYGWCGYAGTWMMMDPALELSAIYMQQMIPNFEAKHQPRLRAAIYGAL